MCSVSGHKFVKISNIKTNKNAVINVVNKRIGRLAAVPPRLPHTTSVETYVCWSFPGDKQIYANPMYPSTNSNTNSVKESLAVQASDDTDALNSSLATSVLPRQSSIFNTSRLPENEASRGLSTFTSRSSSFVSSNHFPSARGEINYSGVRNDATSYHPKHPRYTEFVCLRKRQESFQTPLWSVSTKPEVSILAEYGFFYTEKADLVRCFQCGIGLKDWVKEDDVVAEHIKHSIDCDYLYQKFGKTEVQRLKSALTRKGDVIGTPASLNKIRSPHYQTMESRVASFTTFPQHLLIDPRSLAVAGLFYTGAGDLCRCFACDGGLKDWSTGDDPVKEHATYFPQCWYINQLKGEEYMRKYEYDAKGNGGVPQSCNQEAALRGNYLETTTRETYHWSPPPSRDCYHAAPLQDSYTGASTRDSYHEALSQESSSSVTHSMHRLSIGTNRSGAIANQLFQQLGYSDSDVITARAELERQGNEDPSSEEIVNAILDIQERSNIQVGAEAACGNGNDIQTIAEENERLLGLVRCMLCVTGEPDMLFLPCAHHRVCHDCASSLTLCPVCQKKINKKVKTYRS